ncbi:MAG: hypothetical protein ABW215_11375 [Kibdelosporangium sp.]
MTDRAAPIRTAGHTMRVRVLPSAVKGVAGPGPAVDADSAKPRVYGYIRGRQADQDLLTCWAYEQGWMLSKVFVDEYPGFGSGMSALLQAVRTTDVHGVVMLCDDSYARAIARRITEAGTVCLVVPDTYIDGFVPPADPQ